MVNRSLYLNANSFKATLMSPLFPNDIWSDPSKLFICVVNQNSLVLFAFSVTCQLALQQKNKNRALFRLPTRSLFLKTRSMRWTARWVEDTCSAKGKKGSLKGQEEVAVKVIHKAKVFTSLSLKNSWLSLLLLVDSSLVPFPYVNRNRYSPRLCGQIVHCFDSSLWLVTSNCIHCRKVGVYQKPLSVFSKTMNVNWNTSRRVTKESFPHRKEVNKVSSF